MPKDPSQIKLSILILSIPSRLEQYEILQNKLLDQIGDREDVEVLSFIDNKSLHIYEKRNVLLQAARGSHLCWLDDDDDIADNYISRLTEVIILRGMSFPLIRTPTLTESTLACFVK